MARCEQKSFWANGVKVLSGEATAWTPDGPLKVVCRRARAGEINVQELADGTPLHAPALGYLVFDASRWRGKAGRNVPVEPDHIELAHLPSQLIKRRAFSTRDDKHTILSVLDERSAPVWVHEKSFKAMVRRNKRHWGAICDSIIKHGHSFAAEYAIDVIDDPVLLMHVMNSGDLDDAFTHHLRTLAARRLAEAGHHRDAGAHLLRTIPAEQHTPWLDNRYYDVLRAMPQEYLQEFLRELLHRSFDPGSLLEVIASTSARIPHRPHELEQHTAFLHGALAVLESIRNEPEFAADSVAAALESASRSLRNTLTRSAYPGNDAKKPELSDAELIRVVQEALSGAFFVGAEEVVELVRRDVAPDELREHPEYRWVELFQQYGEVPDHRLMNEFRHPELRVGLLAALPEDELRWAARNSRSKTVTLRALEMLGAYEEIAAMFEDVELPDVRWMSEQVAPATLRELHRCTSSASGRAEVVAEVATYRGVLSAAAAIAHPSAKVRLAAIHKTHDPDLIDAALQDADVAVLTAAVLRSRSDASLAALQERLVRTGPGDAYKLVLYAVAARRRTLQAVELARVSMERDEEIVARAALELITDTELLLELSRHPRLARFVAERLRSVAHRAPLRR